MSGICAALLGLTVALAGTAATSAEPAPMARDLAIMFQVERLALDDLPPDRLSALAATKATLATATEAVDQAAGGEVVAVATRSVPVAVTGPAKLDVLALDAMPTATGDADWRCLAEAIYYESRGEPLAGQIGVAEVVLNRLEDRRYPSTICGVTYQGVGNGRACQFSYACDGLPERMASDIPRQRAEKLAALMLAGRERGVTDGATHFHARYVRPAWSRKFARTAEIGAHIFYRQPSVLAQR